MAESFLEFYARPGRITDPHEYAALFDGLPTNIPALCKVVQGLLIHVFLAEEMGARLSEERKQELNLRMVAKQLARIQEFDPRPLTEPRPIDQRLVCNCRDFSVMLTAMLRHQGVPARARCGFATYFKGNSYEDHWVCEYWNAAQGRWVMVDPQLDEFQRGLFHIKFDTWDMPRGKFIPGGLAWQMCRVGDADPNRFGILTLRGLWFVRGDLVRDFAALNKMELLPWDGWGIMGQPHEEIAEKDNMRLDEVAGLTLADNRSFDALRDLYEHDESLRVPSVIHSYPDGQVQTVELAGTSVVSNVPL